MENKERGGQRFKLVIYSFLEAQTPLIKKWNKSELLDMSSKHTVLNPEHYFKLKEISYLHIKPADCRGKTQG